MATKEQLQQQLTRCEAEMETLIMTALKQGMACMEDSYRRSVAKLHALVVLESQLQAAIKRTPG